VDIRRLMTTLHPPVFLLNSRLGRFSAASFGSVSAWKTHLLEAPLIPKLRGHFAEFLLQDSLEHLRLLASPTCVGLRYGRTCYSHTRLFLVASFEDHCFGASTSTLDPVSPITPGICLRCQATPFHRDFHHPTTLLLPRPPLQSNATHPAREC